MIASLPLGPADVLALAFFLGVWVVFSLAAEGRIVRRISLTQAMNKQREAWMQTMAQRELRMIDTGIMSGLQQGTPSSPRARWWRSAAALPCSAPPTR